MAIKKNPKVDLRLKYRKVIEASLAIALAICIVLFQAFKRFERPQTVKKFEAAKIETIEVPQTQQEKIAPPPSRPAIPIESESEDIPDDVTIDATEINFEEIPPPPPPPPVEDETATFFVAYDEPPMPIGGFEAIQKKLVYPEIARKAGIEGQVTVYAHINEKGEVIDTKILVPLGNSGCNEAAVAAIKAVRWKPAKQRDKPVAVWVSIPVRFKLK
ncbi:MAG: energy transducer TonB [candidate division KSB1 bacterium]|nr:energy transducer TonB [candidate division KSB1 bacterium]MDZ7333521.1 energy transducer TonB [candidate division KSB1 bacterium]MDZ7356725.1 energy transducer TonB [candidate division KSB1 bacterium]MDZ7375685.1 energy transducer TonB [candidate division KSB1 bacterium]MDZ7398635.1 energy transducer TonB [candidate division KSB1 bacterium]